MKLLNDYLDLRIRYLKKVKSEPFSEDVKNCIEQELKESNILDDKSNVIKRMTG